MPGRLTTHVLDTTHGRPAASMRVEVLRLDAGGERHVVKAVRTNADGRTDVPLLADEEFARGVYEIVFEVGEYFRGEPEVPELPFLDRVPIRFGVSDPEAHYHLPLLASPWSYSTYRGELMDTQTLVKRCEMLGRESDERRSSIHPYDSQAMGEVNRVVSGWMQGGRMTARRDVGGNLIGRYEGTGETRRTAS